MKNGYPSIEELRKNKYKVSVSHRRPYLFKDGSVDVVHHNIAEIAGYIKVDNKGGVTVVNITTPTGQELKGIAYCSKKEQFNKRKGVMMAVGRAFKDANISHFTL